MVYGRAQRISASDYNTFIGGQASTVPFPNEASAAGRLAGLWGVGYGTYGYMQNTTWPLVPVDPYTRVEAKQWQALQQAVELSLRHQGQPLTDAPPADYFDAGDRVLVHDGSSAPGLWSSAIAQIEANRLSNARTTPASYQYIGPQITDTRTIPWGDNYPNPPLSFGVIVTWASGDHARAFFNAGGELIIRYRHPNGTSDHDEVWRYQFETAFGDLIYGRDYIDFGGTRTVVPANIANPGGYWNATGSNTKIYSETDIAVHPTIGSTYASGTWMWIWHQRLSPANVSGNGDNGNQLFFGWAHFPNESMGELAAGAYAEVYWNAPIWLPDPLIPTSVVIENPMNPE